MNDLSLPALAGMRFRPKEPVDQIIGDIVGALGDARLAGYVQFRRKDPASGAMLVYCRDLMAADREMAITYDRGKFARACKLDSDAMARLSISLHDDLATRPDALIIARFGRSEADGGGLRDVISQALSQNIPTLVAIRDEYHDAWQAFHGGLARDLELDAQIAIDWLRGCGVSRAA